MDKEQIKFVHLRNYSSDNKREIEPRGGITLAITEKKDSFNVGLAHCSFKDNYNKKIGRLIANGRLINPRNGKFVYSFSKLNYDLQKVIKFYIQLEERKLGDA